MKFIVLAVVVGCAALLVSQQAPQEIVGPQPDGAILLNSGWRLRPAGEIIPLSTFPMSSVLTPDGKYLLVLHGGYRPPSIAVLDAKTLQQVSVAPAPTHGWGWRSRPTAGRCLPEADPAPVCLSSR